ncbi:MAG: CoA-binding protein [Bacteroidetes bacterium]|jgi:predicted CoA-binding protein|nr:CoA-binding protein [Bacteroidota bacterium]
MSQSEPKNTLILGASPQDWRYSFKATERLAAQGHPIYPLGRSEGFIGPHAIHTEWPTNWPIHTITIYLSPKNQAPYYQKIIHSAAKRVVFNPGAENPELESMLTTYQITFEKACTLVLLASGQY